MAYKTYVVETSSTPLTNDCILTGLIGGNSFAAYSVTQIGTSDFYNIVFDITKSDRYSLVVLGSSVFSNKELILANDSELSTDSILGINSSNKLETITKKNMFNLDRASQTEVEAMTATNRGITPANLLQFLNMLNTTYKLALTKGEYLSFADITNKIIETDSNGKVIGEVKNTAFNKNFGNNSTDIAAGNHSHLISKISGYDGGMLNIKPLTATKTINIATNSVLFDNILIPEGAILVAFQSIVSSALTISGGSYSFKTAPTGVGNAITIKSGITDVALNSKINEMFDANINSVKLNSDSNIELEMSGAETISAGTIILTAYYMYLTPITSIGA